MLSSEMPEWTSARSRQRSGTEQPAKNPRNHVMDGVRRECLSKIFPPIFTENSCISRRCWVHPAHSLCPGGVEDGGRAHHDEGGFGASRVHACSRVVAWSAAETSRSYPKISRGVAGSEKTKVAHAREPLAEPRPPAPTSARRSV